MGRVIRRIESECACITRGPRKVEPITIQPVPRVPDGFALVAFNREGVQIEPANSARLTDAQRDSLGLLVVG